VENESTEVGVFRICAVAAFALIVASCASYPAAPAQLAAPVSASSNDYVIGPGDHLQLFVWKSPELSTTTVVGPDGKISLPLIEDIQAAGQTPTSLGHAIRDRLTDYVHDPIVTVMLTTFTGQFNRQIRVIGEAAKPSAFVYSSDMTVLDVMIAVGGLTDFAAGNRAVIVRNVNGRETSFGVKLDSLIRDGDVSANVPMAAGDILIIPESFF
jgi:polysaccharide export outer membrane protein